jgi:hypothetical protein
MSKQLLNMDKEIDKIEKSSVIENSIDLVKEIDKIENSSVSEKSID